MGLILCLTSKKKIAFMGAEAEVVSFFAFLSGLFFYFVSFGCLASSDVQNVTNPSGEALLSGIENVSTDTNIFDVVRTTKDLGLTAGEISIINRPNSLNPDLVGRTIHIASSISLIMADKTYYYIVDIHKLDVSRAVISFELRSGDCIMLGEIMDHSPNLKKAELQPSHPDSIEYINSSSKSKVIYGLTRKTGCLNYVQISGEKKLN